MKTHRSIRAGLALALAGWLLPQLAFAAPAAVELHNAWQITDNSSAGGSTLNYTTNLTLAQQIGATNSTGGFRYSVNARFVDDFSSATESMAMIYGLGNRRFLIWWGLDGSDNLTARLEGGSTYTLTSNGLGTALYHTHEIIYDPASGTASYAVDGIPIATGWPGSAVAFTSGQVYWGAGSSAGKGLMNFHAIDFEISGLDGVASYDAGTSGLSNFVPPPNPTTLGWTLNSGSSTTAAGLSRDLDVLLAVTTTRLDSLTNSNVLVKGQAYSSGSSVLAWFEWGTDTNYGNVTSVQNLGVVSSSVSFSATLPGLLGGPDYHYRAVASNIVGVLRGENNTFNLRFIQDNGLPQRNHPLGGAQDGEHVVTSVADFDNDGWLDLFLTGFALPPAAGVRFSELWRNMGDGTFSNVTSVIAPGLPGIDGPSAWGDFDNDGRLDFLIAGTSEETNRVIQLWRNTAGGFTNVPLPGVPALLGSLSESPSIAWRDYDNDGRLDFLLMGSPPGVFQLWRNTGNGFTNVPIPGLRAFHEGSIAWADYDNDGQADFLAIGNLATNDPPELWWNTGGSFTNVPLPGLPKFANLPSPPLAFGDYDSDGRLDFMVAGLTAVGLVSQLWRNTVNGFTNVPVAGLPGFGNGKMAWGDYNNDGRLDFAITGFTNPSSTFSADCQLWENTGGGFARKSLLAHPDDTSTDNSGGEGGLEGFYGGSLVLADFNRDGRPDILISGRHDVAANSAFYGPRLFLSNMAVTTNQPPTAPANLSVTVSDGRVALGWDVPADDSTPALALTYNVRIGTTAGGRDIVSPPALANGQLTLPEMGTARNGSSTFYLLPPGTYYWSVQAVDGAFAGSPFAAEQQFTITTVPRIIGPLMLGSGQFQFSFTNATGAIYEVLGTTNVALPVGQWEVLGLPTSLGGGLYRFTDALAPGHPQRFYLLRAQ
jgi:hypothetical protein